MSHINNALKKAQEEKDGIYQRYKKLLSAQHHEKGNKKPRWKLATVMVLIIFLLVVACAALYYIFSDITDSKSALHRSMEIKKVLEPLKKPTYRSKISVATSRKAQAVAVSSNKTTQETRTDLKYDKKARASGFPKEMAGNSKKSGKTDEVESLYQQALSYQQKNKLTRAEKIYREILNIDSKHVLALNNLGVIYMSQNKGGKAIHAFSKAINLKSNYVDPYYNLACLYSQSGDTSRSLNYLKKAIKIKNDVKNWAINDIDLNLLHTSDEFRKIVGQSSKVQREKVDTYIVKKDDWIFDIIRTKYRASDKEIPKLLELITRLNPGVKDTNIIHPGQKLLLPKAAKPQGQGNED
jgi:tetratricopeptide (TPR) repeat protein